MTLHLITLVVGFNSYKWIDNPIEVVEKAKVYVVQDSNDYEVMKLVPEVIVKDRVNIVLASKAVNLHQLSLSIYSLSKDVTEAKDKLITEIAKLSDAYRLGFESQREILNNITHDNN